MVEQKSPKPKYIWRTQLCFIYLLMKICTKCKIEKEEEDFVFKNKSKNKKHTICKLCQREYKLKHYYRNKEAHYFRNDVTIDKIRDYVSEQKDHCIVCNESEKVCLDFHHLRDKRNDISRLVRWGSLDKIKEEIQKCVVLCSNCHRKLHAGVIILNI